MRQIVSPWIHKSGWQLCVQQASPVSQAINCLHFSTFLYFQKELSYSFKEEDGHSKEMSAEHC